MRKALILGILLVFLTGLGASQTVSEVTTSASFPTVDYWLFSNITVDNSQSNTDFQGKLLLNGTSRTCDRYTWGSKLQEPYLSPNDDAIADYGGEGSYNDSIEVPAGEIKEYRWQITLGGNQSPICPGNYNITASILDEQKNVLSTGETRFRATKFIVEWGSGNNVTVGRSVPVNASLTAGDSFVTNISITESNRYLTDYFNLSFQGTGDNPIKPEWVEYCGFSDGYKKEVTCFKGDNMTKFEESSWYRDVKMEREGTVNITIPETAQSGDYSGRIRIDQNPSWIETTISVEKETGKPGALPKESSKKPTDLPENSNRENVIDEVLQYLP